MTLESWSIHEGNSVPRHGSCDVLVHFLAMRLTEVRRLEVERFRWDSYGFEISDSLSVLLLWSTDTVTDSTDSTDFHLCHALGFRRLPRPASQVARGAGQ